MNTHKHKAAQVLVSGLSQNKPTFFDITPTEAERRALAADMGLVALKKLRFDGRITPEGKNGFVLTGTLGATVVQECVVTLVPVTTRIDDPVTIRFIPAARMDRYEAAPETGGEVEMPEDDTVEELPDVIDLDAVMQEALALALPAYPRAEGAELAESTYADAGITPLEDEDLKPLAGLAALKAKMEAENSLADTANGEDAPDKSEKPEDPSQ